MRLSYLTCFYWAAANAAGTCEYLDGDSGEGWSDTSTTEIAGVGTFHGPLGLGATESSKTVTETCWMNSTATIRLRVVLAGGWDYEDFTYIDNRDTDYARVFVNNIEIFTGTSHWQVCLEGFTSYDSGDAEAFDNAGWGKCCTKCYSDVEAVIDIPSDGMVTIAVQAATDEVLEDECLYFNNLSIVAESSSTSTSTTNTSSTSTSTTNTTTTSTSTTNTTTTLNQHH